VICLTLILTYIIDRVQQVWNQPFKRNKFHRQQGSCSRFYSRSWKGNQVMIKIMKSRDKVKMQDWTPRCCPTYSVFNDHYHELREFYQSNGYREPKGCPSKVMTALQYSQYLEVHGQKITGQADCCVSLDIANAFFVQVPVNCCHCCHPCLTDVSKTSDEWCFSASKDNVDSPIRYDLDSFHIVIDNCATSCFTNSMEDFIGTPKKTHTRITGIGQGSMVDC
jgi:hypothetical protein